MGDVFENNPTMYFMVDAAGKVWQLTPLALSSLATMSMS